MAPSAWDIGKFHGRGFEEEGFGVEYTREVEPRLLLVHLLRDVIGLTSTHIGCDTSICGSACRFPRADGKGNCEVVGIGVTGLSDKPFRAQATENQLRKDKITSRLIEAAALHVTDGVDPLEDLHANAQYHAHLARVYGARALREAAKQVLGRRA